MTPNRKVTFSWSVSCLFFLFLKSCLLFHFLHFYFLLLFPCFFCCPMIFASVLLSVLPLVVLTCVPLPFCINSVCLPFPVFGRCFCSVVFVFLVAAQLSQFHHGCFSSVSSEFVSECVFVLFIAFVLHASFSLLIIIITYQPTAAVTLVNEVMEDVN